MSEDSPLIRVVAGNPTDEELAAVVAVVSESFVHEVETATVPEPADRWARSGRMRRYRRREWGRFAG
ncbi:acyl-CoA carboxylase subunit epsilon [Microbacterium excoecariae]|uniref:acyl-CoA carboxylase subunit epsilon n=1 Tax=Microbacterium TaxID=33882 RepID=UPI0012B9BBF4|nr:acyl-CoA carboxylase subunit epsilon [Microbacterium sp. ZXX196]NHI17485.1 acyl-CoA carboxylase subunit epsilon [Microbacterium excoecariae]